MDRITVRRQEDIAETESTPGVFRASTFDAADTLMVQSRVAAGAATGWHHNGDRHVYAYVVSGTATLEYGPGGHESVEMAAGDFVYVPPQTIRRVVNGTREDWVAVICFVGSGPPAINVDGPASEPRGES
ncbi:MULTISPECIES: cupin domain-containing protein [unclassified Haladaptatus]|uniref:cupin domain-containing protein n=1 Tax=unclassified Haladaptatus TaxID=2622732 RepID=UPI0023E7C98A|nr:MULTISPECIES: cupin domain-containing protein [unclassified Haladaptatus]